MSPPAEGNYQDDTSYDDQVSRLTKTHSKLDKNFNFDLLEKSAKTLKPSLKFTYIDQKKWGIVWINVVLFVLLHMLALSSIYKVFSNRIWFPLIFGKYDFKYFTILSFYINFNFYIILGILFNVLLDPWISKPIS